MDKLLTELLDFLEADMPFSSSPRSVRMDEAKEHLEKILTETNRALFDEFVCDLYEEHEELRVHAFRSGLLLGLRLMADAHAAD